MSKYLCTFSGKFGDILWSLPTAKFISEKIVNSKVDFCVMPYYKNLLPLLAAQPYIEHAFVKEDWLRTHSNHGDQPWQPPDTIKFKPYEPQEYERMWHLTYKGHPGITAPNMPLIEFVAYQQGICFNDWNPIPFIAPSEDVEELATPIHFSSGQLPDVILEKRLVSYAFNDQYPEPKQKFFEKLWHVTREDGLEFFNVGELGWREAAWIISKSIAYVGCRSADWVLAMGLGQETFTFEPHPSRHKDCHLGRVFGSPYGREFALPFALPPEVAAEACASMLRKRAAEVKQYADVP